MNTEYYTEILKNKVKDSFLPETVSIVGCNSLSKKIFERTQKLVSSSTLQRVFELVDTKSKVSVSTLNILSDYTGFGNWETFKQRHEAPNSNFNEKYIPDEMAITLLGICLKNHDFKTALGYLDKVSPNSDDTKSIIAPVFRKALRTDRKARKILIPELTKTRNRRNLTVERNIDIEYLDTYYRDVIIESKKNIDYSDKSMFNSDISFYNSMLFLHSVNHRSKRNGIKHAYELITKIRPEEAFEDNFFYMFPLVRYNATYLMYLQLSKKLTEKAVTSIVEQVETIIFNVNNDDDLVSFAVSEMFRALVFCKRYNDLIFLYNKYKKLGIVLDGEDSYYQLTMSMVDRSCREVGCGL